MRDSAEEIRHLIELQQSAAEKALKRVLTERDELLASATECERAAQRIPVGQDIASTQAAERWAVAQRKKAVQLRQQASEMEQLVQQRTNELLAEVKKSVSVAEIDKIRARKKALEDELASDTEMMELIQLIRSGD